MEMAQAWRIPFLIGSMRNGSMPVEIAIIFPWNPIRRR